MSNVHDTRINAGLVGVFLANIATLRLTLQIVGKSKHSPAPVMRQPLAGLISYNSYLVLGYRMKTAAILGAGFSKSVGFPLMHELFEHLPKHPQGRRLVEKYYMPVRNAWSYWKKENPDESPEQWLEAIYEQHPFPTFGVMWEDAVSYVLARVVDLPEGGRKSTSMYYHGISNSPPEGSIQRTFWTKFRSAFDVRSVVTANYDIVAEQGLKYSFESSRTEALPFFYGGMPYHSSVRKMINVVADDERSKAVPCMFGRDIGVYKLHGSVNWVVEPARLPDREQEVFKIHDDVRGAFFQSRGRGRVLVVPPISEKSDEKCWIKLMKKGDEKWLRPVWDAAETALADARIWFVCGFALHPRDHLIRSLFHRAARRAAFIRLIICDPYAESVADRWRSILPRDTQIRCVPGLPTVLEDAFWNAIKLPRGQR